MGENGGNHAAVVPATFILFLVALLAPTAPAWAQPAGLTYARDIAPLIRERCAPCHRPGDAAPFSLLTYEDVRAKANLIVQVTKRRYMPPWKPVTGEGGPFAGERRLADEEIARLARWVDQGMPEGETSPPIESASTSEWRLGLPDLVIALPEAYALSADGPDLFRNFVVPIPVEGLRFVAGVEFHLNGTRAVHHANFRLDTTSSSRELDATDPLPGYEGPVGINARYPGGHVLGWTPGQMPAMVPPGTAWRLAPRTDLVLQLHLRKTGKPERVQPSIGFYFTSEIPTRVPLAMRLGRQNIDLSPGQRLVLRDSYRLPVAVQVLSIHPHAHSRATDIKAFADLPDGTRRWLLHIDDWDFNWQDVYRFATPVDLPQGAIIAMEFTYDNSAANPRNADSPPRRVIFGQNAGDEMGDLWLQVLAASPQHRSLLFRDFYPKTVAEDAIGYEMLIKADPNHAGYHTDLALLQARLGRTEQATSHLQTAVRLKPEFAPAHYNLATLHATSGRLNDAEASLRTAIALRPAHADSHNNLGAVLKALGRLDEAIDQFRQAIAIDPEHGEARYNLAAALAVKR